MKLGRLKPYFRSLLSDKYETEALESIELNGTRLVSVLQRDYRDEDGVTAFIVQHIRKVTSELSDVFDNVVKIEIRPASPPKASLTVCDASSHPRLILTMYFQYQSSTTHRIDST